MDAKIRELEFSLNQLRRDANALSKTIGKKVRDKADATGLKEMALVLQAQVDDKAKSYQCVRNEMDRKLLAIGNLVDDSVPVSMNECDNSIVREWGTCREFSSRVPGYHHHELLRMIDGYAPELGVTSSREWECC